MDDFWSLPARHRRWSISGEMSAIWTFQIRDVPILHDRYRDFLNRYTLAALYAVDSDVPVSRLNVLVGLLSEAKHWRASFPFATPFATEGMAYSGGRVLNSAGSATLREGFGRSLHFRRASPPSDVAAAGPLP
jgi:hypothetical protein